uniref:Uncharacterized protein n=1 Tax=Salix viminalis TaxID=40686 RepID=A0A6N2KFF2_SALVM
MTYEEEEKQKEKRVAINHRLVLPRQSPPAYPERFSRFQYSNTVLFKTQMVKCPSSLHDLILFPLHQVAAAFY